MPSCPSSPSSVCRDNHDRHAHAGTPVSTGRSRDRRSCAAAGAPRRRRPGSTRGQGRRNPPGRWRLRHRTTVRCPPVAPRRQLAALLVPFGVQTVQVPIGGTVRTQHITRRRARRTTTKLSRPGPELTADEAAAVARTVVDLAPPRRSWWWGGKPAAAGSAWTSTPARHTALRDSNAGLHRRGRPWPRRWTRGPDLSQAERARARRARRPSARAARRRRGRRRRIPQARRGDGARRQPPGVTGALLVSADEVLRLGAPVQVRSTVGAGIRHWPGFLAGGGRRGGRPS